MPATVVVTRHIAATPEQIWPLVIDLPRMGEWSPESTGGAWQGGATAAAVGARFKGTNANGKKQWSTLSTVVVLDEPTTFAFDVAVGPLKVANWCYRLAADGTGTTVTETWTDQRGRIATFFGGPASGVKDREAHNRAGMEHTLAALATAVEA